MGWLKSACFFALVVFLFLFVYVVGYGASASVVLPHINIVFFTFLGICSLRFFIERLGLRLRSRGLLVFAGSLFWFFGVALLGVYALIFLGLLSWGRVPTLDMLAVYVFDYEFAKVLGFSGLEFFGVGAVCFLVFIFPLLYSFFSGASLKRFLIRADFFVYFVFSVLFLSFALTWVNAYAGNNNHIEEPLSVLLFSRVVEKSQTHNLSVSPLLAHAENSARSGYVPSVVGSNKNVIVIVADALRADHMSVYGYGRETTPYLKGFLRSVNAYQAQRVRSVCAESFCGLMGLAASRPLHLLVNKPISLYEVLQRHGYFVSLALSGDHTNFYGLKDAYGEVDVYFDGVAQSERYVNDDQLLLDWVERLPDFDNKQPQFMQFHLMSTHGLGSVAKQYERYTPFVNFYKWPIREWGRESTSESDKQQAINSYDNGVLQFDALISQLLVELKRKGYLNDALVVITADHGEMLGEQGRFGHRFGVAEPVLNIPLIALRFGYDGEPWPEHALVSQVDIAPTILYELGLKAPDVWQGQALQQLLAARDVFFQQGGLTGIYSTQIPQLLVKYWLESQAGVEHFVIYDQRTGRELTEVPAEHAELFQALLSHWRGVVFKTFVPKAG